MAEGNIILLEKIMNDLLGEVDEISSLYEVDIQLMFDTKGDEKKQEKIDEMIQDFIMKKKTEMIEKKIKKLEKKSCKLEKKIKSKLAKQGKGDFEDYGKEKLYDLKASMLKRVKSLKTNEVNSKV